MPAESTLPEIRIEEDCEGITPEEKDRLRSGTRTPRPYHHDQDGIKNVQRSSFDGQRPDTAELRDEAEALDAVDGTHTPAWTAGSESGTEADDERHHFVKALPAPHLRPRKGLKTGESNEYALLTPSQLDDEGRRLLVDYFGDKIEGKESYEVQSGHEQIEEKEEQLAKRRLGEFARRCSEVALMVGIVLMIFCGNGVWKVVWSWKRELLVHILVIIGLVLGYPVKLSIVDTTSQARKLWQRFRVPASFDPATVLYPPLLPVLVALLLAPANSATILPNIILGLASLPQRLFPRSSRLGGFNSLHWFVSILPLIASEYTRRPHKDWPSMPYSLKIDPATGLTVETLVSLYPLHHALLQPLYYLTTTSLLISELHLLSAALINLLLLTTSPQIYMLKACLWIGGATIFICCAAVVRWNVTLMRVPKWKLRRPGHTAEERKSLVDAVSDLINLQRAAAAWKGDTADDSDADEDEPGVSIKEKAKKRPKLSMSNIKTSLFEDGAPKSANERVTSLNGAFSEHLTPRTRPRRNTLPERESPLDSDRSPSARRKEKTSNLLWCLHLTPAQAKRRKWLYATYTFATMAVVVMVPVRYYVLERALNGFEPIGWAIGYLLGHLEPARDIVDYLALQAWIRLPSTQTNLEDLALTFPLNIPLLRSLLGEANTRLLLIAYWALVLLCGLLAVFSLTALVEVDTRRKVFHGVMVAMMLPSVFVDPCACALALILILAVFLLLEVIRAGQIPPLGNAISRFVAPYVDGRDLRGPIVVSHIFLLIGCAVPLWFSLASINRTGDSPWIGWELEDEKREVAMLAGVICVGMGDAAASLIGRRYGRHKWIWVGGKSLEGSAAFAAAVTMGLVAGKIWLVVGGWNDNNATLDSHLGGLGLWKVLMAWTFTLTKAVVCACGASFMEAVLTGANDNVVVPLALWLMVKGVRL